MVTRTGESRKGGRRRPLGGLVLLAALAAAGAWVFLHPWRPMDLPGPEDAACLGIKSPIPREALSGEVPSPARKPLSSPAPSQASRALLVRDALTRLPLEGVAFFRLASPPVFLGRTDGRGFLALPGGVPWNRLLARKPGYLGTFLGISTPYFRRLRRELQEGGGVLGLAPDPVTLPMRGKALAPGGKPAAGAIVPLPAEDPADPLHPPAGVPTRLAGAWRVALAAESLCRGAPLREPWELGKWGPRARTRAAKDGSFSFRILSRGKALLQGEDGQGHTARLALELPGKGPLLLRLAPGSWIRVEGPSQGLFRVKCRDGWRREGKAGERCGPFLPGEELEIRFFRGGAPAGRFLVQAPPAGKTRKVPFPSQARGRPWTGRVLEKGSGRPVAGVRVELAGGPAVRTDQEGIFHLLLPGRGGRLVTFRGEGIQERTLLVDPAGPLPEVVEVLPASGGTQLLRGFLAKVEGWVKDAAGQPVVSARVRAFREDPPDPGALLPKGILFARTDPEGRFRLLLPAPGRYRLQAFHPRGGAAQREIALGPGEKRNLELVLEPPLLLRGRVVDGRAGRPVEGARVLLSRPGFPSCQGRTGPGGAFLLRPWAPGKWTLQVFGPGGAKKTRILDLPPGGGGEVRLVLGR